MQVPRWYMLHIKMETRFSHPDWNQKSESSSMAGDIKSKCPPNLHTGTKITKNKWPNQQSDLKPPQSSQSRLTVCSGNLHDHGQQRHQRQQLDVHGFRNGLLSLPPLHSSARLCPPAPLRLQLKLQWEGAERERGSPTFSGGRGVGPRRGGESRGGGEEKTSLIVNVLAGSQWAASVLHVTFLS